MIEYRDHLIPYHWLPTLQDTKYQTSPCSDSHAVFQLQGVQRISHSSISPRKPFHTETVGSRDSMLESSVLRCISSSGTPPQRSFHRDAAGCKSASQVAVVLVSAAPSVQRPYQSVERYHSSIMDVPALPSASKYSICLQQTIETHRSGPFVKKSTQLFLSSDVQLNTPWRKH
jgi:hypothetical protein